MLISEAIIMASIRGSNLPLSDWDALDQQLNDNFIYEGNPNCDDTQSMDEDGSVLKTEPPKRPPSPAVEGVGNVLRR